MNTKSLALLAALSVIALTGAANAGSPKGTQTNTITLDGYCDSIKITHFPWHQAGTLRTGCGDTLVGTGMEGPVPGEGYHSKKTLSIGENSNTIGKTFLWNIQYPLKNGGGWSLFSTTDGVSFSYVNEGTYTITAPGHREIHIGPSASQPVRN